MGSGGALTKSGIVFTLVLFYTCVFIFIGAIYSTEIIDSTDNPTGFSQFGGGFFGNIILGINDMPIWLNAIVFTPLVILLSWVVISSLPLINGGG
ncbi:MAG TPA: hypothetical protein VMZ91_01560 [Candidatus Paceibacterota bacterium]|nr:hypothetical protein [Candidatus Paceibacterota bacterium]